MLFGSFNKEKTSVFDVYCELNFSYINLSKLGYKNAIEIDSMFISKSNRIRGLGTAIYKYLITQGFTVVSGGMQFLRAYHN